MPVRLTPFTPLDSRSDVRRASCTAAWEGSAASMASRIRPSWPLGSPSSSMKSQAQMRGQPEIRSKLDECRGLFPGDRGFPLRAAALNPLGGVALLLDLRQLEVGPFDQRVCRGPVLRMPGDAG